MPKPSKKTVSLHTVFEEDLYEKLREKAFKENRSMTDIIREALNQFFKKK